MRVTEPIEPPSLPSDPPSFATILMELVRPLRASVVPIESRRVVA
jgi:hypothetical protein